MLRHIWRYSVLDASGTAPSIQCTAACFFSMSGAGHENEARTHTTTQTEIEWHQTTEGVLSVLQGQRSHGASQRSINDQPCKYCHSDGNLESTADRWWMVEGAASAKCTSLFAKLPGHICTHSRRGPTIWVILGHWQQTAFLICCH